MNSRRSLSSPPTMVTGLRRTDYEQRRDRIVDTAAQLFLERGYDAVSTAEVAAAAGVAEKTVFNHFPRKEHLVFRRFDEVLDDFERMLRSRDHSRPLTDVLVDDLRERFRSEPPGEIVAVARIVAASPSLTRRQFELFDEHARLVERILTEEWPAHGTGGLLRAISLALVGVHWSVMTERGSALAGGTDVPTANRRALDAAERAYAVFDLDRLRLVP